MDIQEQKTYLSSLFSDHGFRISEKQTEQLLKYYRLLIDKNRVMNLTAITDFEEVCIKHFLDSALLIRYIEKDPEKMTEKGEGPSLIDIGTGAGFPGIPLKILRPEIHVTLMDSLKKRIDFLSEVIRDLQLSEIETVHARAEDLAKERRENYDFAVSRAVAYLPVLSEYCLPFVKTGGQFIAYKSGNFEEEVKASENALKILGGEMEKIQTFTLPDGSERALLFINKVSSTPDKYPRRSKKIETRPL